MTECPIYKATMNQIIIKLNTASLSESKTIPPLIYKSIGIEVFYKNTLKSSDVILSKDSGASCLRRTDILITTNYSYSLFTHSILYQNDEEFLDTTNISVDHDAIMMTHLKNTLSSRFIFAKAPTENKFKIFYKRKQDKENHHHYIKWLFSLNQEEYLSIISTT